MPDTHLPGIHDAGDAQPRALHLHRDAVLRVLRPLIAQELASLTGRRLSPAEADGWPDDLDLGEDGLGLDSLGSIACAAAVDRLFHLHETGAEGHLLLERRLGAWTGIVQAALEHGVSGFTFASSGSTGRPKRFTHSLPCLLAEAAHWAATFAGRRRIVLAVPAHHIYGMIFGVLLPEALGVPVLERRGAVPGAILRDLRPGDLLVGFPAGHALLADAAVAPPPDVVATSSTAPLPAATHRALRALGFAGVTEVYGSSETAGIACRTGPDEPYRLLPRWRPAGADALFDTLTRRATPLPDHVEWVGPDTLRPATRRDQVVQVAGTNVHPAQVAEALREHPGVAAAAVRLDTALPEPRLKAFVVPSPGADMAVLPAALDAWCASRFPAPERPVRFAFGAALPCNPLGKAADWEG
ncbi:MAG TPA: 4-coumarate--CoA ligase [Acetobacteraceae bacterium]|nr:4-coumarate--CoA ligase [Acetobacteraceae bacterium]